MTNKIFWVVMRWYFGLLFLWAFFDKLFGLGFATKSANSWLKGGSPTAGFLKFAHGPLAFAYHNLSGLAAIDWLFMVGICAIGFALILGVGVQIASWSGALLTFSMWLALLPPDNHPFLDQHVLYMICFVGLATLGKESGQTFGFGKCWLGSKLVQRFKFLQ